MLNFKKTGTFTWNDLNYPPVTLLMDNFEKDLTDTHYVFKFKHLYSIISVLQQSPATSRIYKTSFYLNSLTSQNHILLPFLFVSLA